MNKFCGYVVSRFPGSKTAAHALRKSGLQRDSLAIWPECISMISWHGISQRCGSCEYHPNLVIVIYNLTGDIGRPPHYSTPPITRKTPLTFDQCWHATLYLREREEERVALYIQNQLLRSTHIYTRKRDGVTPRMWVEPMCLLEKIHRLVHNCQV